MFVCFLDCLLGRWGVCLVACLFAVSDLAMSVSPFHDGLTDMASLRVDLVRLSHNDPRDILFAGIFLRDLLLVCRAFSTFKLSRK